MINPIRFLKNLFVDFLILVSGTYVGSPESPKSIKNSTPDEKDTSSE